MSEQAQDWSMLVAYIAGLIVGLIVGLVLVTLLAIRRSRKIDRLVSDIEATADRISRLGKEAG